MDYGRNDKISAMTLSGDTITRPVLILEVGNNNSANEKAPKSKIRLSDGEKEYSINAFFEVEELKRQLIVDKIYTIKFKYVKSGSSFYINIDSKDFLEDTTARIEDFAIVACSDGERLYNEIINIVSSLNLDNQPSLSSLTIKIYEENKEKLIKWTAAKCNHHVGIGGLILHTHRMVQVANAYANIYPELDKELLICGAALHDIGKLEEYDMDKRGASEVTYQYILLGHLLTGAILIHEKAKEIGCPEERTILLEHMIASHHGKAEYGSIKGPAIPEAVVLSHIDDADAKINEYTTVYKTELKVSGAISVKKHGSDYPNYIYKP